MAARMRRTTRHSSRFAAGGLLIAAATFLPAAGSQAQTRELEAPVDYTCQFPSGTYAMTAVLTGRIPAGGPAGRPLEPQDIAVGLDLPSPVVAELAALGAGSVSARADLTVLHSQGEETATADWSGLSAPAQDITGEEEVAIEVSGPVPTATFPSAGPATLSAGDLKFSLQPLRADGAATEPGVIEAACTPADGTDTALATVVIRGGEGAEPVSPADPAAPVEPTEPAAPSDPGRAEPGAPVIEGKLPPGTREKLEAARREAKALDEAPEPCPFPPIPLPSPAETYVAGYANAEKMRGAARLGPALLKVTLMKEYIPDPCTSTFKVKSEADFEYEGRRQLPPAKATFLTYGFMPTTATMELIQVGPPARIESVSVTSDPTMPEYTTVTAEFEMRISDVEINGVPLDVGPDCRTVKPIKQTLNAFGTGNPPSGYTVNRGGSMDGETYIPAFTGCGVGEDVSSLLTSSVSGGGNYIKMTQAPLCVIADTTSPDCPAKKPTPER
ncbi:hypothetical protein CP967_02640 [Streptomyces nitrosporeus]|uniref:DUF6801 domain-containing protein n=1 Tax=Streptomyces nitrosporeus TaxID=28894 RepID=A0A5J6F3U4_9ACTN|nr:DUF6801 domain-containing protein [Streptomyces nitrosporeus]QEU70999.1 hypothetical protein CP967_02640 [Streptomyces nitrosporeus]GGZ22728.1 hypothetical protein GCM10010327_62000 [Streptomyces nitrosporeus]